MWSWDGSIVNLDDSLVEEVSIEDKLFWRIYPPDAPRFYVLVKGSKTPHYCFVDQVKTIFGLQPYGCHYTHYKGGYKILFRIAYYLGSEPDADIMVAWSPFDFGYFKEYLESVVTIILFRAFLGISPNNIGHINVLIQDKTFALVPDYSSIFNPGTPVERGISQLLEKKIFRAYPEVVATCLRKMVGPHPSQYHKYRYRIQSALEEVAARINISLSSKIGIIMNRITTIYQSYLA